MVAFATTRRRGLLTAAIPLTMLLVLTTRSVPQVYYANTWQSAKGYFRPEGQQQAQTLSNDIPPYVDTFFDQVFSEDRQAQQYAYPALAEACAAAPWSTEDVFLRCGGMSAGMTSIMSQVKVCLKMAIESGSGLVLPTMPLRDSTDLLNFNFMNPAAYLPYEEWFDVAHLREVMGQACPKIRILHPNELDQNVPVKHMWSVRCSDAWGYRPIHPYFWVGRPFKNFFADQLAHLRATAMADPKTDPTKKGITVVTIDSAFLLFRITDDPTRRDLRFWTDLSHVLRFTAKPRQVIHRLRAQLGARPYIGVHLRVENDSIWSSFDSQVARDLDALDRVHDLAGGGEAGGERPLVYVACGDEGQVDAFSDAAKARGWGVTHKWRLSRGDAETTRMIGDLAFDFQGAVDLGLMIRSRFFLGVGGSAFSSTVANHRDVTGRYRGSSFELVDDEGARNHLFNDLDADEYACCL